MIQTFWLSYEPPSPPTTSTIPTKQNRAQQYEMRHKAVEMKIRLLPDLPSRRRGGGRWPGRGGGSVKQALQESPVSRGHLFSDAHFLLTTAIIHHTNSLSHSFLSLPSRTYLGLPSWINTWRVPLRGIQTSFTNIHSDYTNNLPRYAQILIRHIRGGKRRRGRGWSSSYNEIY
jgi:hypothetical protein